MRDTCFLLGAGASVEAGLPAMARLRSDFLTAYEEPVLSGCLHEFVREADRVFPQHVEGLLSYLSEIAMSGDDAQERRTAAILVYEIKKFILRQVSLPAKNLFYLDGFHQFLDSPPLDVFTMNYDSVIESWCEHQHIGYTDGFNRHGMWEHHLLGSDQIPLRIWKLHGSITWEQHEEGLRRANPLGTLREELRTGELRSRTFDATIIYPAAPKKAESILEWLQHSFADRLRNLENLIAIGYSFADEHIGRHIAEALSHNDRLHVVICTLDPDTAHHNLRQHVLPAHHDRVHAHKKTCGETLQPGTLRGIIARSNRPTPATRRAWTPPLYTGTPPTTTKALRSRPLPVGMLILNCACNIIAQHDRILAFLARNDDTWTLYTVRYPIPAGASPTAVCIGFHDPRGLAITQDSTYIVDAMIHGRYMGAGGIWHVNLSTSKTTMLVGRPRPGGVMTLLRRRNVDTAPLGILRWPTSITVNNDHLLVTESRRLVKVHPTTGQITLITGASFLNLNGIAILGDFEVLAFEHVLSAARTPGSGVGTLWKIDLHGRTEPHVITGGLTNARGVATNSRHTAAYIGEVQPGGYWQIVRVDLTSGEREHLEGGYTGKPAFTITQDDNLLIGTPEGLYQRPAP